MADKHHAEWLSLLDISGPFLSPPVLERVFPQGLDVADPDHTAKLRLAYEEWAEEQHKADPDPAINDAWIRFILTETLGLTPGVLLEGDGIPAELEFVSPEHGETIRPDFVVFDPEDEPVTRKPRLLISMWPADTELDQPVADARWTASPIDRMIALCRSEPVGLRLGLVTNGEQWALVDAPVGETSAHASWYANLWGPEPLTLRAFRSLLGLRRFFGVADNDRLDAMLVESANYQTEVTDQLGFQVRRAVEVLVQAIDRADADTGRTLLADTDPARIYEAALTVMMRLVFLFSAEERGLLRLGDPMYDQFYAVSTLHAQLQEAADLVGPEVLERRQDAWSRLLGTFRAIYGGIHHQDLQIIPYGSSLFDPDRFPFLEGRTDDTTWRDTDSLPLPIDNRTVLLLLRSLQMLDLGKGKGARKLSFRALDIEQIGHVYETLLDHSAYRATEPMVSLQGNQGREPEIPVSKLIDLILHDSDEPLVEYLKAELKKGVSPIRKALERGRTPEPEAVARLRRACGGDDILLGKLLPFNELIRLDPWDDPVVIPKGAVFVTAGEDRRLTGTHYTPRALTEEIVQYALEPVVYRGPAEGKDREEWELKSPDEILDLKICDPAMGSGAFLVQACRYLADRLVESWEQSGRSTINGGETDLLPADPEERLSFARRLVADRCLYGVDVNPLAVEMAKLSMWLITLASDTPFTFLDHALRCGDSLLGVHDLRQIRYFHNEPPKGRRLHTTLFDPISALADALLRAEDLRTELRAFVVRDIYDERRKSLLHGDAEAAMSDLRLVADALVWTLLEAADAGERDLDTLLGQSLERIRAWLTGEVGRSSVEDKLNSVRRGVSIADGAALRLLHWPLEFPEVFSDRDGFDAVLANPPFLGGLRISEVLGFQYNSYLARQFPPFSKRVDLCAFFFRRASSLLRQSGCAGLLATNSISQGTTRKGGLDVLVDQGYAIYRGEKSFQWPASASVHAAKVWYTRAQWEGVRICAGVQCEFIGPLLEPEDAETRFPERLDANAKRCFQGSVMWGKGFFLSDQEAASLLALDPRNKEVVRPVLGGKELNSEVPIRPIRWAIDMGERTGQEVQDYPGPYAHLLKHVKPERDKRDPEKYPRIAETWWKYFHGRLELYGGIRELGLDRVLARARVSGYHAVAFVPADIVYTDMLVIFLFDDFGTFGVLQSSIHELWAARYQSSLGTAPRYITTDCFHTFPLPPSGTETWATLASVGETYYSERGRLMELNGKGMTSTYRDVHDKSVSHEMVVGIRDRTVELDNAVADSFGWSDLKMSHGFHPSPNGMRFGPSPDARSEVLSRLLELNYERAAAEQSADNARSRSADEQGSQTDAAGTLFNDGEIE